MDWQLDLVLSPSVSVNYALSRGVLNMFQVHQSGVATCKTAVSLTLTSQPLTSVSWD